MEKMIEDLLNKGYTYDSFRENKPYMFDDVLNEGAAIGGVMEFENGEASGRQLAGDAATKGVRDVTDGTEGRGQAEVDKTGVYIGVPAGKLGVGTLDQTAWANPLAARSAVPDAAGGRVAKFQKAFAAAPAAEKAQMADWSPEKPDMSIDKNGNVVDNNTHKVMSVNAAPKVAPKSNILSKAKNFFGLSENKEMFENILREARQFTDSPEDLLWLINDAGYECEDDDIHWYLDDFYSNFDHYLKDDIHTWEEFISESEYDVDRIENYCRELQTNPGATEKVKELANKILGCISKARGEEAAAAEKAEAMKDPKNIIKDIEESAFDNFISAYQVGNNIWVDLDTEDEDEANDVAAEIESEILHNNRKHGRDDLQGMGQWHINVGTVADFSEDSYDDLDEDVRDMYQIIIEPAESYRKRRQYDGY